MILVALSGRYSNPVEIITTDESAGQEVTEQPRKPRRYLKRLTESQVDELVMLYEQGQTIIQLVEHFGIQRATVMSHLKRRGIATRVVQRKLCDADVARAAELYQVGTSLAALGEMFGVNDTTIHREFKKAGIPTRPRRGA